LFEDEFDLLLKISKVSNTLSQYKKNINIFTMDECVDAYISFFVESWKLKGG
jgi:hypothetical protein